MNEDCDELEKESKEHENAAVNLLMEAEELHKKALKTRAPKRIEALSEAFDKQKEALDEIRVVRSLKKKVREDCEDASGQL